MAEKDPDSTEMAQRKDEEQGVEKQEVASLKSDQFSRNHSMKLLQYTAVLDT